MNRRLFCLAAVLALTLPLGPGSIFPLGPSASNGGGGFLPQAQQFFNRTTGLTDAQKTKYNTMTGSMLSCPDGSNAYAQLDALLLTDAPTSTIALTNIIQASYGGVVHGTMTFAANQGFTGNGSTGYIDTQFNPSTATSPNYSAAAATVGVGILTSRTATNSAGDFGAEFTYFFPNNGGNVTFFGINDNGIGNPTWITPNAQGLWVLNRIAGVAAVNLWQNATNLINFGGETFPAVDGHSFAVGAVNTNGVVSNFSTDQIGFYFIGGGLTTTQIVCVSNAINTFLAGDGNNLYPVTNGFTALASSSLSSIFSGAAASTLPLFGVNSHITVDDNGSQPITPAQTITLAQTTLGANFVRGDYANWIQVEPSGGGSGSYTFAVSDPYLTGVGSLPAAGITVDVPCLYSNTNYDSMTIFTGPTAAIGADGVTAYVNYCGGSSGLAHRYGTTNMIYELWNEENICTGGYAWAPSCSAANYSTLMTATAAAAHTNASGAVVITGGLADAGATTDFATYGASINSGLTWTFVAGAAFHPYNAGTASGTPPEQAITDQATLAAAITNTSKFYWNEVGYQTGNTVNTETQKAIYDARLILSAVVARVQGIALYEMVSDGGYGLFNSSFAPFPAATAFEKVAAALKQCTGSVGASWNTSNVWDISCAISGGEIHIVWPSYGAYKFTQASSSITSAAAIDVLGNNVPVTVAGNNGTFSVVDTIGPVIETVVH